MTLNELSLSRLYNQQVSSTNFKTASGLVGWMGAMQAQDYNMARWACGVRLPGTTSNTIQEAIDRGEIIRTHVLRPTWHLVSAKDAGWMLDLTSPHIKSSMKGRHRELELTPAIVNKSLKIIEKALSKGAHLTREELVSNLEKVKIATHDQRIHHILLLAELNKIICSGKIRGKKNTYTLFSERVSESQKTPREESLKNLITRYFNSHGPATLTDFVWWSGLPVADARNALEMVKHDFNSEKIDSQTYWFEHALMPEKKKESLYLLPAFDEFVISYKDRSACLSPENRALSISGNGIFWPVIVLDGQVIGLWKRMIVKNKMVIETKYFSPRTKRENKNLEELITKASAKVRDFFMA